MEKQNMDPGLLLASQLPEAAQAQATLLTRCPGGP